MSVVYVPAGAVTEQFHNSDTFVRGIMGPMGSGKSVACCMEIAMRALEQLPSVLDGVRRTRAVAIRQCFDDQTEILTEYRGWVLFKNLQETDKVAMLQEGKLVFTLPTFYYSAPYQGDLIGFEGEGIDFLVTPTHKLYVSHATTRKKVWGEYSLERACDIYGKSDFRVKRDALWEGQELELPEKFFEWLGLWFAEGHVGTYMQGRRHLTITQCKSDGVEYTRELFDSMEVPYYETRRGDRVNFCVKLCRQDDPSHIGNRLFKLLETHKGATTKQLPFWVKQAPSAYLQAFIKGFCAGDGHKRKDSITQTAYTSSKQLADDLQEIALKAGLVANLSSRNRIGQRMVINGTVTAPTAIEYTLTFVSPKKYAPKLQKATDSNTQYRGWHTQPYDGEVYCVEVPTHVIYVRRNGKTHWTSNSYPELKSTTIETWLHWFPEKVFGKMKWDAPIRHRIKLARDCELDMWFLALERPDDVKKLLGCEATLIWLNEARELPKEVLDMSTIRVGRYPESTRWSGVIMDTNPPSDDHWWYRLAEEEKPENFEFFRQASALSAAAENLNNLNQTPETKAFPLNHPDRIMRGRQYYLRSVAGKSNDWVKVNVEAQYGNVQGGRPVYPEFNDTLHVASTPLIANRALPLLLGFDFGLDPACTITQITPRGQWIILDEVTSFDAREGQGLVQFIDGQLKPLLALKYPGYKIISLHDPAGVQRSQADEVTCRQILKQKGLNPSTVGTNNFTARREAVASFLSRLVGGEPAFLMSPTCKVLRKAMNGDYGFKRVQVPGEDRYRDVPDKTKSSHVAESCQYIALHIARPNQHDSKPKINRMQRYTPASAAGY